MKNMECPKCHDKDIDHIHVDHWPGNGEKYNGGDAYLCLNCFNLWGDENIIPHLFNMGLINE